MLGGKQISSAGSAWSRPEDRSGSLSAIAVL